MDPTQLALIEAAAYVLLPNADADAGYTPERRNDLSRVLIQYALQRHYQAPS